ncbi:2Fe-2S iron-sulfur cluster-binding protein [Craterilacuibacter sp.]|uniref:2Fe-2S iron-sulfur cluster-binding protein n=1 Tax=Craterilacuibacter sp. TaxID=2870909 RepID=UPI003F35FA54
MVCIRFFKDSGGPLQQLAVSTGVTLQEVARQHDLPLRWRCGHGTCGACLVKIIYAGQPASFEPVARERNVLKRFGFAASPHALWPDDADTWRLACHVVVGAHDLDVQLKSD